MLLVLLLPPSTFWAVGNLLALHQSLGVIEGLVLQAGHAQNVAFYLGINQTIQKHHLDHLVAVIDIYVTAVLFLKIHNVWRLL